MISPEILIFAGTTEGRKLAEYASEHDINCYVSTATEYGKSILGDLKGIECISGRMDETEIEDFVKDHDIHLVIDATHPFAVKVTKNIRSACQTADIQYIRCPEIKSTEETGRTDIRSPVPGRGRGRRTYAGTPEPAGYTSHPGRAEHRTG